MPMVTHMQGSDSFAACITTQHLRMITRQQRARFDAELVKVAVECKAHKQLLLYVGGSSQRFAVQEALAAPCAALMLRDGYVLMKHVQKRDVVAGGAVESSVVHARVIDSAHKCLNQAG